MTTIDFSVVGDGEITRIKVQGRVSANDILKMFSDFYQKAPTRLVFCDATDAIASDITSEEVRMLANRISSLVRQRGSDARTAVLSSSDVIFGLVRMFEAYADVERVPVSYRSFRDENSAMNWLCDETSEMRA